MQCQKHSPAFLCKITNLFIGLMFSFFLLWPGLNGYAAIKEAKFRTFLVLAGTYLTVMLFFSVYHSVTTYLFSFKLKEFPQKISITQICVLIYLLLTCFSTFFSPHRAQALIGMTRYEGFITQLLYCGTFLCVSTFAKPKRWMGWVFAASMIVFCGICLLQLSGLNPFHLYPGNLTYFDANIQYAGIYLGTIGNADLVAALLCLALPVFIGLSLGEQTAFRYCYLLSAALCAIVLIKMGVQAGLVGASLGLLLALPKLLPLSSKGRKIAIFAMIVLLLAGITVLLLMDTQSGTIYELQQVLRGNWQDTFGSGRIYIWRQVLELVPKRPLLGFGPDTMSAWGISGYFWYHAQSDTTIPLMVDAAHNEYLNILFHQGIPALLAYLGALAVTAVHWLRSRDAASAALGAGLLCYLIQAFFGFSMCHTAGLFWLMWALLERIHIQKREEPNL